ncbi:uncharacterized protein LOC114536391 [Dendronephthya gigantea]|uniref:uncharacterized protein LOC114536391 n=1 Tax=Dendronephthya gigantea TaxID=151771 RepID=UPI00106B939B|nr:uncharacterized protein LOC114536391 [Dendronephthya gigantea]
MYGVRVLFLLIVINLQVFQVKAVSCTVDAIYYSTASAIKGVFSDGSGKRVISSVNGVKLRYDSMKKRLIYYNGTGLVTVKLDGTNATTLATNVSIERFTVDDATKKVYYISNHSRKIHSIDLLSKNSAQLNVSFGDVQDLDIDNGSLILADARSRSIIRYIPNEKTRQVIYDQNISPKYLVVDSHHKVIYWTSQSKASNSYSLMKTYFNGSTSQIKSHPDNTSFVDIAIGTDDFYAMDSTRQIIYIFDRRTATFQKSFRLDDIVKEITAVEDLDECCGKYCHNNATCTNTPGGYLCTCKRGYAGNGRNCEDIDECQTTPSQCGSNANCVNTNGSYICKCESGYEENRNRCSDINECQSNPCDVNANCTNIIGSYECTCKGGYEGNGMSCSGSNNHEISSGNNTVIIVGFVVAAVVLLVISMAIVGYCFYRSRRKPMNGTTQDFPSTDNPAYKPDMEAEIEAEIEADIEHYTVPYSNDPQNMYASDGVYEELDNSKRETIDKNYQSLISKSNQQLNACHYEDVQLYASVNKERKPKNDDFSDSDSSSINI